MKNLIKSFLKCCYLFGIGFFAFMYATILNNNPILTGIINFFIIGWLCILAGLLHLTILLNERDKGRNKE